VEEKMGRTIRSRAASWLVVAAVTAVLSPLSMSFAAQNGPNTVNSAAIIAADGTSGQTLTTGNGVKTGHIQDGAVTTGKIADGAITDAKVGGTISGSKLGAHGHNGSDIMDGTVTGAKLTAGSVDNSKISGIIGQEKLGTYSNVITVHKGAANNVTTFNSIRAAIDYIGQNTNSYTGERQAILVMPGLYETDLTLFGPGVPFNVDIIGTSRTGTIIRPVGGTYFSQYSMTIPSGMYLRNLTFQGLIDVSHSKDAGVIGVDVVVAPPAVGNRDQLAGFTDGWQTIRNFTIDDVYIETVVGSTAISLWGTGENDTLRFNNIRIKGGNIQIVYPITSKPYTFSNIYFSGGSPDQPLFNISWANINTLGPKFILTNITSDGSYGYGFYMGNSSTSKISVMNSKIDIITDLYTGVSSSDNVMTVINSDIAIASNTRSSNPVGSLSIGNSRIGTVIPSGQSIKLVNCFDGNFEPYANGLY